MAKSFKNSIKNMVTELGLKTTLEITEMEINKLLFGLGREYVKKNVTPLCISLCEILAEKTGVEETFLNRDAVELKESRGRTHMIEFVSKLGLDVYVYKTDTNNNSQFIYNLDWDSEELQSKPNVLYKLFDGLVNIYARRKRITLNRFRLVENVREVIKSLLNEHKMTSRIVNLIDNLGLLETLKVTDLSFDDLSDMVKNSVFTRKIKINFIKEFSDSLLDGYDMSTNDTIVYTEYCDKEHEAYIAYVQKEGITVDIYERKWFNIIKSVLIKFNEVDDYYIDIIFDYMTNYYDTYVNKLYEQKRLSESFDSGVEPELKYKSSDNNSETYTYELPSSKNDSKYSIEFKFHKKYEDLKNVLEIDFSFGSDSAFWGITSLNEVFYILSSIKFLLDKFKSKFKYLIIHTTPNRMSVYKRALSRVDYLEVFREYNDSVIIFKNKTKWSLF